MCFHSILKGQDYRTGAYHWAHGLGRLRHLPGLHCHQDSIHNPDLLGIIFGLHGLYDEIPFQAIHP